MLCVLRLAVRGRPCLGQSSALMQRGGGREAGEVYTGVVLEGGFAIGGFDLVGGCGAVEI